MLLWVKRILVKHDTSSNTSLSYHRTTSPRHCYTTTTTTIKIATNISSILVHLPTDPIDHCIRFFFPSFHLLILSPVHPSSLFVAGNLVLAAAAFTLAINFQVIHSTPLAIFCLALAMFGFSIGPGPLTLVVVNEMLPLKLRGRGVAASVCFFFCLFVCRRKKNSDKSSSHLNCHMIGRKYLFDFFFFKSTAKRCFERVNHVALQAAFVFVHVCLNSWYPERFC